MVVRNRLKSVSASFEVYSTTLHTSCALLVFILIRAHFHPAVSFCYITSEFYQFSFDVIYSHLQNKSFALKVKFQRNASKFPIFI